MRGHLYLSVALLLAAASSATAKEFFVGRWSSNLATCSVTGEGPTARPMIITENSLHRLSMSCRVGKMYKAGRAVYIQAYCSIEGRITTIPVTLEERGQRLGVIWDGGQMEEMQRCP